MYSTAAKQSSCMGAANTWQGDDTKAASPNSRSETRAQRAKGHTKNEVCCKGMWFGT